MTNFIENIKEGFSIINEELEEHFGIVSLALMFVALAAITAIPCLADLI